MTKKLLIIGIIIILVVSGILGYLWWQKEIGLSGKEKRGVLISTDKSEYSQGEVVKITIKNQSDKPIWYKKGTGFAFPAKVQKSENGEWKDIIRYNACHCVECLPQPPYLVELRPGEVLEDKWNMKIFEGQRPLCGESVPFASPGRYRAYFSYFLSSEAEQKEIKVYSNEFTIKTGETDTSTWKTYRNETYGFEIKYPSDWEVSLWKTDIGVTFKKENCNFDIQEIEQEVYEDRKRLIPEGCSPEEGVINEISFTKIVCPTKWGFTKYYFQKGDKYYWIYPQDRADLLKTKEPIPETFLPDCWRYFNQMLSTFRFLR